MSFSASTYAHKSQCICIWWIKSLGSTDRCTATSFIVLSVSFLLGIAIFWMTWHQNCWRAKLQAMRICGSIFVSEDVKHTSKKLLVVCLLAFMKSAITWLKDYQSLNAKYFIQTKWKFKQELHLIHSELLVSIYLCFLLVGVKPNLSRKHS